MKEKVSASPGDRKIFVLDTSVILYDHNAIKNFEEHDIVIPIQVLEELDHFKKGNDTRNFEAREFIRLIDDISKNNLLNEWIPLNGPTKGRFRIAVNENGIEPEKDAVRLFGNDKNDHKILNAALSLQKKYADKKVILVTKDTCLRLKAKALNIRAEDYETGKIHDVDKLYTGKTVLQQVSDEAIGLLYEKGAVSPEQLGLTEVKENEYFIISAPEKPLLGYYNAQSRLIERIHWQEVYGVSPRNAEQAFAIHALLNPRIKLVTIQGVAGTGKTLLAMASALQQRRNYRQIFITCPVIPLSNRDIGFLPGDIKSKLDPYLQPYWDTLSFIKDLHGNEDKNGKRIDEMLESEKIAIAPLAYIRGRSFSKVFFIIDEAQNLTPHEVKTIISRAGDDTKMVFMGDIHQIDTPYLDAESNGLSYLIDRIKNNPLFAHITLEKGERSALANLANLYL
ncbi:MAG: phosphate starvation protein PhoH [Chitinophagales bacterium]|nr:MAG: phosphate starvation protein PhoH [Chitinophagales bacterium]